MPYLSTTLRPQGQLLCGYSLLDDSGLANQIAAVSGQPPNAGDRCRLPDLRRVPCRHKSRRERSDPQRRLCLPGRNADPRRPARQRPLQLACLRGGNGRRGRQPDNCVYPGPEEADEHVARRLCGPAEPLRLLPLAARPGRLLDATTYRSTELTRTWARPRRRRTTRFIAPTLCNAGTAGQCPAGTADGPASADAFPAEWVPKILASPAYKEDGLLIAHLRRRQPRPVRRPHRTKTRCE